MVGTISISTFNNYGIVQFSAVPALAGETPAASPAPRREHHHLPRLHHSECYDPASLPLQSCVDKSTSFSISQQSFPPHAAPERSAVTSASSTQLASPKIAPSPVLLTAADALLDYDIAPFLETLQTWLQGSITQLLYDSRYDMLTSRSFNQAVCGHKNVLVAVTTGKGNVFGCFTSRQVPHNKSDGFVYVKNDRRHFVFSLRNASGAPPVRFDPKACDKSTKSLCVSGAKNENCVVACYAAFFIESKPGESTFDFTFPTFFANVPAEGVAFFDGAQAFTTARLLAFRV